MESKVWSVKPKEDMNWIEDGKWKIYVAHRPTSEGFSCQTESAYRFAPVEKITDDSWISKVDYGPE